MGIWMLIIAVIMYVIYTADSTDGFLELATKVFCITSGILFLRGVISILIAIPIAIFS
jgi:hypothetical protein